MRWTPDLRGWRRSVLVGTLSWRNGNCRSSGAALGRPAPSFDSARLHAEGMAARRNPQFTLTTHNSRSNPQQVDVSFLIGIVVRGRSHAPPCQYASDAEMSCRCSGSVDMLQ